MENTEYRGHDMGLGPLTWRSYLPLVAVFGVIFAIAGADGLRDWRMGDFVLRETTLTFMAVFFIVFAAFKLTSLKGFVDGYSTYDLLAMRARWYAYLYPFIELGFGLAMIAGFHGTGLLWAEFTVMIFSGLGVARKLLRHELLQCVCLGTWLKVPLTSVTLVEDFGMAALALILAIAK